MSTSRAVCEHHGKDESYHPCQPADVVVFPTCVEQVSEIARTVQQGAHSSDTIWNWNRTGGWSWS